MGVFEIRSPMSEIRVIQRRTLNEGEYLERNEAGLEMKIHLPLAVDDSEEKGRLAHIVSRNELHLRLDCAVWQLFFVGDAHAGNDPGAIEEGIRVAVECFGQSSSRFRCQQH